MYNSGKDKGIEPCWKYGTENMGTMPSLMKSIGAISNLKSQITSLTLYIPFSSEPVAIPLKNMKSPSSATWMDNGMTTVVAEGESDE